MTNRQSAFIYLGLAVAIGTSVATLWETGSILKKQGPEYHPTRGGGGSPVRIMGGSIRFHSESMWTDTPKKSGIQTVHSLDLSAITFDDECEPQFKAKEAPPASISPPWKLTVYARFSDGKMITASKNGVIVCSNLAQDEKDCDLSATATTPGTVSIVPLNFGQINKLYPPPDDKGEKKQHRYRGVDDDNKPCNPDLGYCDYAKSITLQIKNQTWTWNSPRGSCRVDIGPPAP